MHKIFYFIILFLKIVVRTNSINNVDIKIDTEDKNGEVRKKLKRENSKSKSNANKNSNISKTYLIKEKGVKIKINFKNLFYI